VLEGRRRFHGSGGPPAWPAQKFWGPGGGLGGPGPPFPFFFFKGGKIPSPLSFFFFFPFLYICYIIYNILSLYTKSLYNLAKVLYIISCSLYILWV